MKQILSTFILLLALTGNAMAQTETASRLYQEAIADKSKIEDFLKRDFSAVDSISMHDLAVLFYQDNDYRSAGACWEIALQKVKKHGKAYEKMLSALSLVYTELNDNAKIEWLMQVIEEHNMQELLKECNDYKCKLERAQYYMMHGDESKAREYITESFTLCQTEEQRIEVEEEYAKLLFTVRDFESSAQYYRSASDRWKKLGANMVNVGTDMYWAAQNYQIALKYELAEACSREALDCFKGQQSETEKQFYLMSVLSLGDALFCQKKYQEAHEAYKIGLAGYAAWMPNTEKHADVLEDMAKVEVWLKMFDEAKEHYRQALDIYKALNIDNKYYSTYSSLIVCFRKSGDNDTADMMETEAEKRMDEVQQRLLESELPTLETTRKYLGSLVYANSLNTIAGCYFGIGNFEESAVYFALYAENLRNMLREKFVLMTENNRQRIWKEQQQHIDDFCYDMAVLPDSASHLMSRFIPTYYDLELLSKGIMLNSSIEFENVLHSLGDKKLMNAYEQIKSNQQQIEELQKVASDENLQKVLALKQQNIPLEQMLMNGCRAAKDYTEYLSYTWKDVQKKLTPGDVAIEFASVQQSPLDNDTYLLALILTSEGEPVMEVVSTKTIIKNLEKREDLYDNPNYYQFVWGFLNKHLEGKTRIYFAPNNLLSGIAIEYLKEGDKPFFEKHEVYRLSSTKELCRNREKSTNKNIALFGNIDYNTTFVSETKGALSFGQLAYSKEELDGISACVKGKYKVQRYEDKKATEFAFMKLSDKCPGILHVSSHGAYHGDSKTSADEAMYLSVLALTGANVPQQPSENDGLVRASDVAKMNLRECDLAVLSACQTGLGGLAEDGVFGLQRGFKNAGVHSLLMSLKPVYDESTSKLMITFYQGLVNGLTKRGALLNAQKALREAGYSEGKYWAPFILLDALE